MNQAISEYLSEVQRELITGDAKEHSYRPAFKKLTEALVKDIQAINEPAYTGGNAPDFLFKKDGVPIAYAECKDLTVETTDKETVAQAVRYVEAFGKILLTNYLEFRILDENGEVTKIAIATKSGSKIEPIESNFDRFENLIKDYITPSSRTIRSAKKLAEIMAGKGRLLRDNSLAALRENKESDIYSQYRAFKEVLIRDLSEEEFADMYAQTLVYGLFVARYFDPSLKDFSRHEAQDLLPSSNPLLKKFFGHVAGTEFDHKVAWMVDSLIEAYKSTDVRELMHKEFEKKQKDPVLHFYETFLTEYDKDLRKNRGVYYTPEPVVSFIVRSVDQILKTKFELPKGLSDTSKIEHEFRVQGSDGRRKDGSKKVTEKIHKVQILDPAVGTGTFLNEIIHEIYKGFKGQEGRWSSYVEKELLPRLHGFELMMASYTMAHLKLGVTLKELGFNNLNERLSVWLTNSLEESVHEVPNLFMSQWLTQESNEAARIKSEMPIMVVTGNPPYSVSSANKGEYILQLISDYKTGLNEKKINLDDDYIKFIRFAENAIERTGYGVVAMITNNSFIDGITHRQMRKHLMGTFNEVYVLDLHGSAKKKETGNVFNIQQGVSISLFVRNCDDGPSKIFHYELDCSQKDKFEYLNKNDVSTLNWQELTPEDPYYFWVPKDLQKSQREVFSISALFKEFGNGIGTDRDKLFYDFDQKVLEERIETFFSDNGIETPFKDDYKVQNSSSYPLLDRRSNCRFDTDYVKPVLYRPFDQRWIYYDQRLTSRPASKVMDHIINGENLALLVTRQLSSKEFKHVFVSEIICDRDPLSVATKERTQVFPAYLYSEDGSKEPNLNEEIWKRISGVVGETLPEDILDYVYAWLYSHKYREEYKEFLKIDFPSIPYPEDKTNFWKLVELGKKLRQLHLLKSKDLSELTTNFPESGDNKIEKKFPIFKENRVYINSTQYFEGITQSVWQFQIGGYQIARKWLLDRKDRCLSYEDTETYQQILTAISQTIEIMDEIDNVVNL